MFRTLQPCKPPGDYKMLSQMIQYVRPHYIIYDPICFSCLAQMSQLKHNCYLCTKVCTLRLSFLAVFYNCRHGSWLSDLRTNLYENLAYIPHVACSYHIKLQIGLFACFETGSPLQQHTMLAALQSGFLPPTFCYPVRQRSSIIVRTCHQDLHSGRPCQY